MGESVLQPWLSDAGLKLQSILLSGLRSPDQKTVAVKKCVRWMRAKCLLDADPGKQSYMQKVDLTRELIDEAIAELEYVTVHCAHHFADAMAVVAYLHPDSEVCSLAYYAHEQVAAERFHFKPETRSEFLFRHRDNRTEHDREWCREEDQ